MNAGEEVLWTCAACRQGASGLLLTAGDLHLTRDRLILQPPRWARPPDLATQSYALGECKSFQRGDLRRLGRYPTWGSNAWKRMRLELADGETVEIAVRRPKRATEAVSAAIDAARNYREPGTS